MNIYLKYNSLINIYFTEISIFILEVNLVRFKLEIIIFTLIKHTCPYGELKFVGGMFYPLHPQGEGGVVEPTESKGVALLGGVVARNLRST
jgi:hypothetical protein